MSWFPFPSLESVVGPEGCGEVYCTQLPPLPKAWASSRFQTHTGALLTPGDCVHMYTSHTPRSHRQEKPGPNRQMGNTCCANMAPILKLKDVLDNIKWT